MFEPAFLNLTGRPLLPTRHEARQARTRLGWPTGFLEARAGLSAGVLEPFERGDAFLEPAELLQLEHAFSEARIQFIDGKVKALEPCEGLVDIGDPIAMIARSYIRFHHIQASQQNADTARRFIRRSLRKPHEGGPTCIMT